MSKEAVKIRLKLPRELHQDVAVDANIRVHSMVQEIIEKLQQSVDENEAVMVSDRLQRLIYAKSLAYSAMP